MCRSMRFIVPSATSQDVRHHFLESQSCRRNVHGIALYLPRSVPMTLGTRELVDAARQSRAVAACLLKPPINTQLDHPGIDSGGLSADVLTVVIVSRVATLMKQEGIERTIGAVGSIGRGREIRLLVAGNGSALGAIQERATRVNESLDHEIVIMTGAMNDPGLAIRRPISSSEWGVPYYGGWRSANLQSSSASRLHPAGDSGDNGHVRQNRCLRHRRGTTASR